MRDISHDEMIELRNLNVWPGRLPPDKQARRDFLYKKFIGK